MDLVSSASDRSLLRVDRWKERREEGDWGRRRRDGIVRWERRSRSRERGSGISAPALGLDGLVGGG